MWPDDQSRENLSDSDVSCDKSPASVCDSGKDPKKLEARSLKSKDKPRPQPLQQRQMNKSVSSPHMTISISGGEVIKRHSASRDSSLNDDRKSTIDSISATSGKQNWSIKGVADDDPSISSFKGDSVSATIANFNRKHRAQTVDSQSRHSTRNEIGDEPSSPRTDDLSSNVNFYAAGGSLVGMTSVRASSSRPGDFASISSNVNTDSFDVIEESSNLSSSEDVCRNDSRSHKSNRNKSKSSSQKSKHHQSRQRHRKTSSTRQSTNLYQTLEVDDLPQNVAEYQIEPIILRGNGNLTLFGLSNSFSSDFPSALIGKVSKEEFRNTMAKVNSLLRDQQSLSAKLLLFGALCCCCSFGISLVWPSVALKKRSKTSIQKFLASENSRLYSKLGMNWRLAEQRCLSNHAFVEYVLMIEFTPKMNLYQPD